MNSKKDILEDAGLKRNPFEVPEGYFDTLEDKVRNRIQSQQTRENVWIAKLKPAFVMGIMFLVIAGFGLLASKITAKMYPDVPAQENTIYALIDEGWLDSGFIYNLYDEIDIQEALTNSLESLSGMETEIGQTVESSLTQEELMEYLFEADR